MKTVHLSEDEAKALRLLVQTIEECVEDFYKSGSKYIGPARTAFTKIQQTRLAATKT